MSEIRIRAAEPGDADAIHVMMNMPLAQANTLQLPWRSLEFRRQWLARSDPSANSLVAEIDGLVVGQLGLHLETNPRRHGVASIGMAVRDDFHGRGVGSALMAAMLELADNWLGIRRIELTVYTDNAAAVRLYEKFGFVIEGTARSYAMRNGMYIDAYYMARVR